MNVYNSAGGYGQDDTDVTMINHSFIYDGTDEPISSCIPIVRRVQQANQSKSINNTSESDDRHEHTYSGQDLLAIARQIEQILHFYRRDLAQESNTQLDCNQQLITRLVDFIRPSYSFDEHQMRGLEGLYKDIFDLQESRFTKQKEKTEQLTNETINLRKLMVPPSIDLIGGESFMVFNPPTSEKKSRNPLGTSMDKEEWIEMNEEIEQLYHLIQTQRERIDELLQLLPRTEAVNEETENSVSEVPDMIKVERSGSNDEFSIIPNEIPTTNHAETSLSPPPMVNTHPAEPLECPYCKEVLLNHDDIAYIAHLSQCYKEMTGSF